MFKHFTCINNKCVFTVLFYFSNNTIIQCRRDICRNKSFVPHSMFIQRLAFTTENFVNTSDKLKKLSN